MAVAAAAPPLNAAMHTARGRAFFGGLGVRVGNSVGNRIGSRESRQKKPCDIEKGVEQNCREIQLGSGGFNRPPGWNAKIKEGRGVLAAQRRIRY